MTTKKSPPGRSLMAGLRTMAEGIALQRFAETMLPEDQRIFSDPYAIHFINPAMLAWGRDHPAEVSAMREEIERKMPGWGNAIRGRIRYFDDIVADAPGKGFRQLVIPGAGYDTRAYRIGTLNDRMRIFEIDRPEIVTRKTAILTKVIGPLPDRVACIPLDLGQESMWAALERAGFSPAAKTLFLLEGLVMYLPRPAVDRLLAEIAQNARAGSAVIFDFVPQSLSDGTSESEGGQHIRDGTIQAGEPILSGFAGGEVVPYLAGLGYSGVQVIPSRVFAERYFTGTRADRKVSGLMSLASAEVQK